MGELDRSAESTIILEEEESGYKENEHFLPLGIKDQETDARDDLHNILAGPNSQDESQSIPMMSVSDRAVPSEPPTTDIKAVFGIISVMLIGVFISQVDSTLVMATIPNITSEFDDLQSTGWLFSSFGLAACVAQPLYGKFSDIFGRRAMLIGAYTFFGLGGIVCGIGRSMFEVILGRVIQGFGAAGMVVLVSIVIADLVPVRDIAVYRSYVNIFQTLGRSCGGPIGGALAQTIGWRWAFLCQIPMIVVAVTLVALKLDVKSKGKAEDIFDSRARGFWAKLKRVDFLGSLFLSLTILTGLLIINMGGQQVPWLSPTIGFLTLGAITSGILFYITESWIAKEPVFPLYFLTHREILLDYFFLLVQIAGQTALMLYIPLYFQITQDLNPASAGAHMVPAVVGNASGGLLSGAYVKRTSRYKLLLVLAGVSATTCFTLILLTWHGNTPLWQSMFVFFGGFATGIAGSAVYVDLAATVDESQMSIASSGLYLSASIGAVTSASAASVLFGSGLRFKLTEVLTGMPNGLEIAEKAQLNVEFAQNLTGKVHALVVSAYVYGFRYVYAFSLVCSCGTLLSALMIREKKFI